MGDSNTVYETVEFEYVSVTPDIITIVKEEYGGTIPDSVKDSSRALKIKIGENEWFYLLLSKDEKILYYAGDEFFLEGTDIASNAKVYSGYLGADYIETRIIEISENIGFIILKGNNNIAKIGTIEYCTDITNNWSDINVTNNIGPYTKVILDNSGLPLMVYSETSDAWAETHRHFESNKLKSIEINEIKFTRNKNMKKEEIQQYIEMPFTPN